MKISGKHLFTFAVIADTHMNQEENYSSSPYPANALANARTRQVVAELNQHRPEFVVHLGDIVNPVPELPTYDAAANHFKHLVSELQAPLHLVSGNHDVGDKPVAWMPAGTVDEHGLQLFEQHFGAHFYAVDRNDLHLVVINAQIINSGLHAEQAQREWLQADLAANRNQRNFWFIHYPPYVSNPNEHGSYDNIDEPGRSWLLGLIEQYKPEGLFCGHVHNFWYDVIGETEMYILPSTAFVRHDYSEMFRIGPGDQWGRNDEAKLGYFLVRVYETGHVIECIRTYGKELAEGDALPAPPSRLRVPQTKESLASSIAIDLRHAWAEEMVVAPSGAVDEFERKLARNDYPVLALWEMGIKSLRVPLQDLVDERVRKRMDIMTRAGHSFHVHSYGLPSAPAQALLARFQHLVSRLEIVINWENARGTISAIESLRASVDVPVFLSRVNRKDAAKHTGGRYNHLISHGFVLQEGEELQALLDAHDSNGVIAGVMVSVAREQAPSEAAQAAQLLASRLNREVCLYIKSNSSSPAEGFEDDTSNACRTAEAVAVALCAGPVDVVLDTLDDMDRGYFARSGLVDRRFNPKAASRIVGHLIAEFGDGTWSVQGIDEAPCRSLRLRSGEQQSRLLLPHAPCLVAEGTIVVNLDSGEVDRNRGQTISVPTVVRT